MSRRRSIRYILALNKQEKKLLQDMAWDSGGAMGELLRRLIREEKEKRDGCRPRPDKGEKG